MDELDRDVAGVGPGRRRRPERDQAGATRKSFRHAMAAAGEPLGLAPEEILTGDEPPVDQLVERPRARRRAGARGRPRLDRVLAHPCGRRRVSERTGMRAFTVDFGLDHPA